MPAKAMTGVMLAMLGGAALAQNNPPTPSLELLEFLAEFGDVDAQTYDVIEYHAQRDRSASAGIDSDELKPANGGDLQ